jgi:predicted ATPase
LKIKAFEVTGLFGKPGKVQAEFNSDLNIFTGRNGAGKTTLLKLLWYMISGNVLLATREVVFSKATIVTDQYEYTLHRLGQAHCRAEMTIGSESYLFEDEVDNEGDVVSNAEDYLNRKLLEFGASVFFPTFRRIEGGFTLNKARPRFLPLGQPTRTSKSDVEEALLALSRRLTNDPHIFVSAISTVDIVTLLLRQYADFSEIANNLQQEMSQGIIEKIKAFRSETGGLKSTTADEIIDSIRADIEDMEKRREDIMSPLDAIRRIVETLFTHTGINFGTRLSFGDAASAVNSDALSAGEKQMLSFICYNAFYKNAIILIDEPELSLHVDWQRQLFSVLQQQQETNQFIVATHSPFIYTKYPDKEIVVDPDRGDLEL